METEVFHVAPVPASGEGAATVREAVDRADLFVLSTPLYVDSPALPGHPVLRAYRSAPGGEVRTTSVSLFDSSPW